jgi:hypothetical protein
MAGDPVPCGWYAPVSSWSFMAAAALLGSNRSKKARFYQLRGPVAMTCLKL